MRCFLYVPRLTHTAIRTVRLPGNGAAPRRRRRGPESVTQVTGGAHAPDLRRVPPSLPTLSVHVPAAAWCVAPALRRAAGLDHGRRRWPCITGTASYGGFMKWFRRLLLPALLTAAPPAPGPIPASSSPDPAAPWLSRRRAHAALHPRLHRLPCSTRRSRAPRESCAPSPSDSSLLTPPALAPPVDSLTHGMRVPRNPLARRPGDM